MIFSTKVIYIMLLLFIILLEPLYIQPALSHNNNNIIIPFAKSSVTIDGNLEEKEWNDAFKTNFTSSRKEGNVIVYLKYNYSDQSLNGAFTIPDSTPSITKNKLDQIAFLFDVTHNADNKSIQTNSNNHQIVFGRDKKAEYYIGQNEYSGYKWQSNSTDTYILSTMLNLINPLSRVDFKVNSESNNWRGEFKIYFKENPRLYGFAIQQTDNNPPAKPKFINYPADETEAYSPSTWGDISFIDLNQYRKNVEKFCSKNPASISPNGNQILCITSVFPTSIEEGDSHRIAIAGKIGDLINGNGISDIGVRVYLTNSKGIIVHPFKEPLPTTDNDGAYQYLLDNIDLEKGEYKIFAEPISDKFRGLNASSELIVNSHVITMQELGAYLGLVATAVGLIVMIPPLRTNFIKKRQRNNLFIKLKEINDIYDYARRHHNKDDCFTSLKEKRNDILYMLNDGGISEEQYGVLDAKISACEEKL